MKTIYLLLLSILPAFAQPSVPAYAVVNSASYSPVGLPNSGVAQGSIFTIFGTGLSGAVQSAGAFPLTASLGGTSVQITSGSTVTPALMLYVSSTQISAILPSSVAVGAASLTVSYNSQTSPAADFQVVTSSFGIYSVNGQGDGNAVVTNAQYQLFGPTTAALAGDVVTLWGTGLGPVSGDEAAGPLPGNLSSIPVKVWVGPQPANVLYSGRSGCCAGLDQIAFTIPAGVGGCYAFIYIQTGNVVSNTGYLPIGLGSRTCEEPDVPETSGLLQQWMQQGTLNYGDLFLMHATYLGASEPSSQDLVFADFQSYPYQSNSGIPSIRPAEGTCQVYPYYPSTGNSSDEPVYLDAGSALTLTGATGTMTIPTNPSGGYAIENQSQYLSPGIYTISGPGGTGVGAFTATLSIPQTFTWTNVDSVQSITQSAGQLITWSGADPSSTVLIEGSSSTPGFRTGAGFTCAAAPGDGQFTIPPFVLLSLPVTQLDPNDGPLGGLSVEEENVSSFSASGLTFGYGVAIYSIGTNAVTYQ